MRALRRRRRPRRWPTRWAWSSWGRCRSSRRCPRAATPASPWCSAGPRPAAGAFPSPRRTIVRRRCRRSPWPAVRRLLDAVEAALRTGCGADGRRGAGARASPRRAVRRARAAPRSRRLGQDHRSMCLGRRRPQLGPDRLVGSRSSEGLSASSAVPYWQQDQLQVLRRRHDHGQLARSRPAPASTGRTHRLAMVSWSSCRGSCACSACDERVSNRRRSPMGVIQWLT